MWHGVLLRGTEAEFGRQSGFKQIGSAKPSPFQAFQEGGSVGAQLQRFRSYGPNYLTAIGATVEPVPPWIFSG